MLRTGRTWRVRRRKAEEMFTAGARQAEVATALGVSRQCAHNWYWHWRGGDAQAFRERRRHAGRKSKLSAEQLMLVEEALRKGPAAAGYEGERWTLWRVADVVERLTGVRYHPSSVWRILRALGWTRQLPEELEQPGKRYIPREWSAPGTEETVGVGSSEGDSESHLPLKPR